jgi:hypothetical protein
LFFRFFESENLRTNRTITSREDPFNVPGDGHVHKRPGEHDGEHAAHVDPVVEQVLVEHLEVELLAAAIVLEQHLDDEEEAVVGEEADHVLEACPGAVEEVEGAEQPDDQGDHFGHKGCKRQE